MTVAEVTNANETEIAYTSFESDGKGNWSFTGNISLDPSAPTGNKVYNISTGSISKSTGLSSSVTYIVSYWTKNTSAFSITGTQSGYPISGPVINGWKFFMHKISGQTQVTIGGSGYIDELRLYPASAKMTSYTFEPLTGMTSACDVNNRITYYEYDGAGRLKLVRDQNKYIVKRICYNVAGQPENCSIYYNSETSGSFTRNNCGSGYMGSSVNYVVPANTYSGSSLSAANNLAQNDVNANGQTYANTNGTCILASTVQGYNSKTSNYNVRFTNNETGIYYLFTLNANTFGFYNLGQIPTGTYTVLFYPAGSPQSSTFIVNGFSQFGMGATFNNITISSSTSAYMY